MCALTDTKWIVYHIIPDARLSVGIGAKNQLPEAERFFFSKLNKTTNILCFLIFFFFCFWKIWEPWPIRDILDFAK